MASQGMTIVHNCLCTGPIILLHIQVKGLSGMVHRRTPLSMHGLFKSICRCSEAKSMNILYIRGEAVQVY